MSEESSQTQPTPAQPPKRKRGRPAQPMDQATALKAVAHAIAGQGRVSIENQTAATEAQARLAARCGMDPAEFRSQLAVKVSEIATDLAHSIAESVKAGTLEPRDQLIGFGIMVDKHEALTGSRSAPILHQTNIQINGMSRNDALKALTAKRTDFLPINALTNAPAREAITVEAIETAKPSTNDLRKPDVVMPSISTSDSDRPST
jgi:hypothetical protein